MKTATSIFFLLLFTLFQSAIAQKIKTVAPKIENHSKGELEIKILSFGENNPISIGKVTADGTIHFNWPELDLSKINEDEYHTTSIKNLIGTKFCKDPNAIIANENVELVQTKFIYVFKYDQVVGCIIPSTQHGQEHIEKQLGSTINWIYSYNETSAKANCSKRVEWEDLYSFDETTAYDLKFKKGWNLVSNSLTAIEEWDKGAEKGSLPKTKILQSIVEIPTNIHWHLKYWANDELIEIKQQIITETPITKQRFESWSPKKLGNLKRTGIEVGKELERMPSTNNVNLLFEKGSKKVDLTIVDCAGNEEAANMYTLMKDMASRDWKDKTETGYESASQMDGKRVMIDYNEKEVKTTLSYSAQNRFLIKAESGNVEPEELWTYLKKLNFETLIK